MNIRDMLRLTLRFVALAALIFGITRVLRLGDDPDQSQLRMLSIAAVLCVAALAGRWALRDER